MAAPGSGPKGAQRVLAAMQRTASGFRRGSLIADFAAVICVVGLHRFVVGSLRRLDFAGRRDEEEYGGQHEEEWDVRGSVPVLRFVTDGVNSSDEQRFDIGNEQESPGTKAAATAAGVRTAYFAGLRDGATVCLCSAGGGHLLGVTGASGVENAVELEILQYGSDGSSVSQVDWADGAARLPTVTSESTWIVKVRGDGLISFASCRANGRLLKAVKNGNDTHSLGGTSSSRQELWRINEKEGVLSSVAFPSISLGWEVVELKATPTAALRESERVQLREARKMRSQVQSAELRLRDSDKKKRDSVATLQQEAESLQLLTDKQQCKIDELEGSLRHAQAQLHNSQTSVAELDRLVVQMAGEKQKAVQTVQLEQQEQIASLQAELADERSAHEARLNGILYEKKLLEDRNEEMIASLNQMNTTKDAELLELQEERLRLSATIKDIADRVGSVSPISKANHPYRNDIDSSPSFRDDIHSFAGGFDVDVSRTNVGGRRIGGPRGGSAATRLF